MLYYTYSNIICQVFGSAIKEAEKKLWKALTSIMFLPSRENLTFKKKRERCENYGIYDKYTLSDL